ncbi:MAG: hypothetical protein K5841_10375, partial [Fretibacterium sp.]|nr:hypothetical protein [Fretibacterium sp.]
FSPYLMGSFCEVSVAIRWGVSGMKFLQECLTERFPNPFMPDTPQRIATDTSQKLPIRYGENFKAQQAAARLNNRPRKCLGFHTPSEVFFKRYSLLHLA